MIETALIGHNVTIKASAIISEGCFVGSNSYLRNGVYLAPGAKVDLLALQREEDLGAVNDLSEDVRQDIDNLYLNPAGTAQAKRPWWPATEWPSPPKNASATGFPTSGGYRRYRPLSGFSLSLKP